jgi:hypothetical protein
MNTENEDQWSPTPRQRQEMKEAAAVTGKGIAAAVYEEIQKSMQEAIDRMYTDPEMRRAIDSMRSGPGFEDVINTQTGMVFRCHDPAFIDEDGNQVFPDESTRVRAPQEDHSLPVDPAAFDQPKLDTAPAAIPRQAEPTGEKCATFSDFVRQRMPNARGLARRAARQAIKENHRWARALLQRRKREQDNQG